MYLTDIDILNVGPVKDLSLRLPFHGDGRPKPVLLVGENGAGKTTVLSYVADALTLFAQQVYSDVLPAKGHGHAYFRLVSPANQARESAFALVLQRFDHAGSAHLYAEKTGTVDLEVLRERLSRYTGIDVPGENKNHKAVVSDNTTAETVFQGEALCFFPSTRRERAYWLTQEAEERITIDLTPRWTGILRKPLVVESSLAQTASWVADVLVDARVEVEWREPSRQYHLLGGVPDSGLTLQNLNALLRKILRDDTARFDLRSRGHGFGRVGIRCAGRDLAGLDALSGGEATLFNMFATVIRYAERSDYTKSQNLGSIKGLVLIDEVDIHLHSDIQHDLLPELISLFPAVQFILSTHSPLFVIGLEKKLGETGVEIVSMPEGRTISAERFREFERSFEVYRKTKRFEDELVAEAERMSKPKVLLEGETDPMYVVKALEALGRKDLLERLDVEWVGAKAGGGNSNSGKDGLNATFRAMAANPGLVHQRILFLYDCDTKKPQLSAGLLRTESIPFLQDGFARAGIENILPSRADVQALFSGTESEFRVRFYRSQTTTDEYGAEKKIEGFQKMEFAKWFCSTAGSAQWQGFLPLVEILERFLSGA